MGSRYSTGCRWGADGPDPFSSTTISPEAIPTVPSNDIPLGLSVALSTPVGFVVGDMFAIVLHPVGVMGTPQLNAGVWAGSLVANGYEGGTALVGHDANNLAPDYLYVQGQPTTYDLHFRTFMTPVPEPATMILAALGGMVLLANGRRRTAW